MPRDGGAVADPTTMTLVASKAEKMSTSVASATFSGAIQWPERNSHCNAVSLLLEALKKL